MAKKKPTTRKPASESASWDSMTPAQRRVEIAKDVIKWIESKKLLVSTNAYFRTTRKFKGIGPGKPSDPISKKEAAAIRSGCQMCARGAMAIARIDRFNHISREELGIGAYGDFEVSMFGLGKSTETALRDAFSSLDLSMIECAFECRIIHVSANSLSASESKKLCARSGVLVRFGNQFPDPEDRLLAIMQNIVDHNGTFKPSVKYEIYMK